MKLPQKFYNRNTLKVAQGLLGKILARKYRGKILSGMIVETEAYAGEEDKACHASKGMTERNKIMFGKAGHAYIYMIYGMYYCLNIVTEKEKYPAAVLIRAIEPIEGIEAMKKYRDVRPINKLTPLTNGPGKLCQALKIDIKLNGENLSGDKIRIEDRGVMTERRDIVKAKRVGIDYAGKSRNYLWRFYIEGNNFVSQYK